MALIFRFRTKKTETRMDKEFTTVSIPTSLYKKIEEAIKGTDVTSVSSYIAKVVREGFWPRMSLPKKSSTRKTRRRSRNA